MKAIGIILSFLIFILMVYPSAYALQFLADTYNLANNSPLQLVLIIIPIAFYVVMWLEIVYRFNRWFKSNIK